jgi:arylsulfatase A-like enzyme
MADDLGWGELGCYGQKKIRTPNIDRLAAEGMKFSTFYSGSSVCAPSRCTLLTGLHTGHSYIRDNGELKGEEGQRPIPADLPTVATHLKKAGYRTACVGKWGLGGPGSAGVPNAHGFDHYYGYLCQRVAHNLYPTHLWRNDQRHDLQGNVPGNLVGKQYAPDLMADDAVKFIDDHAAAKSPEPFFLYYATPLPHLALQAPAEAIAPYVAMKWDDPAYPGGKGYLPHPTPRACYAAMVSKVDEHVGRLLDAVRRAGQDQNTIFLFTSDNGTTFDLGGIDPPFFKGAGDLRGYKQDLYEGGIRVPMIARWPGRIAAGATTAHVAAMWDIAPTLLDLIGQKWPGEIDGISFAPTLLGKPGEQKAHDHLYWEWHAANGRRAVRMGDWKAVQYGVKRKKPGAVELYNLAKDPSEATDLAAQHPEIVAKAVELFRTSRTPSNFEQWNFE